MIDCHDKLRHMLQSKKGALYIALSGGIDSLTLMTVAAGVRAQPTIAMHAVSAAVPVEATERCRSLAGRFGWQLQEINAFEFESEQYLSNPHNRCYYCKSSLFTAISACKEVAVSGTIATGTNVDDLGDFRPGLKAAAEQQVWQPYVEAGVNKSTIRQIAKAAGLGDLSQLPAAPCLSSRVETGIAINPDDLRLIHQVEKLITQMTTPGDIRCRLMKQGVIVQLPAGSAILLDEELRQSASTGVHKLCLTAGKVFNGFEQYKKGSAFIKPEAVIRAGI